MPKVKLIIIIIVAFLCGLLLRSGTLGNIRKVAQVLLGERFSDSKSLTANEKPYIQFIKLETPKSVRQGESFNMTAYFKPLRRVGANYKLFVHLYTGTGKGWINADRFPVPSTQEWGASQEAKIGPMQIFISEDAPVGKYNIEMGLFYAKKVDGDERYIRLPYTNQRSHIVGSIEVTRARKIKEGMVLARMAKETKMKLNNSEYGIGIESSLRKIFRPIEKYSGAIANQVNISAARNEYEAFQIVVIPLRKNLEDVEVLAGDLKNINNEHAIASKYIALRPVGYIETEKPDYPTEFIGAWPDPLLLDKKFSAIKGEVQPIWVTVYVPPDAASGYYEGYITVKPKNSAESRIKVNLRVYNFQLPQRFHLRTAFDLYDGYIGKYYEASGQDLNNMQLKYFNDMLAHRLSPIYVYGNPPESRDSMGSRVLDFSGYDRNLEFCLPRGLNAFSIVRKWGGENDNIWGTDKEVQELLLCYADYLKMRNLFDMAYIYVFDEPNPRNAEKIRNITKLIHEISPDLKTLVTTHPDEIWGKDIDIWCPHLTNFREDAAEQEKAKGKQVWWYVSGMRPGTPAFNIDLPAIDHRILFWMNWKYKVNGLLYWCINYWKKNPWETAMTWKDENGNGCLLYPGPEGPVDTIRIEVIRDGIEDYEYFYILNNLLARLEENNSHPDLIAEAKKLLNIENGIIASSSNYTKEPEAILKYRERLGTLIEKMANSLIAKKN